MAKVVRCAEVDPSSKCQFVARGATEEELLRTVQQHATEHGIREVTPELLARVKSLIKTE
jgi:predicted small metal-binding protein